ncbi:hypothetical protein PLICRDRAFT_172803 [Plicaturopsis crispa FD-325 SS-3]|nr:hypothetical protein PLICRDRAFT_172803 [Plicaturopsis crispa FD-325 SS-3]
MASAPLQSALSLLSAVAAASQHPAFQSYMAPKAQPTTSTVPVTAVPQRPTPQAPPSAPISIPNNPPPANANNTNLMGSSPPQVTSAQTLCEACHLRPKFHDGTKLHPYCSKSCAAKAKSNSGGAGTTPNANSSTGLCDFCHNRPKYSDGTTTHSFCSKSCAQKSNARNPPQRHRSTKAAPGMCQIPGCNKPSSNGSNGIVGDYCSTAHKYLAENACLVCRKSQKQGGSHFCGKTCADRAEKMAPAILEVPQGHSTFNSVADQFQTSWRHAGTPCPSVTGVYKILSTPASLAKYSAYRAAAETRGHFVASGRSAGNENRRWHGTRRECTLGDNGQMTQFCSSPTCSLCCIIKTSFDLSLFGKKTGWGRFGKGIYTSSTSSKSNDYAQNKATSNLKAMLLNKVVVGKGYKLTHDNTTLSAPPAGYDSVLAEKGGTLNYDELVVYDNDAIRPSWLVMYDA